MAGRATVDPDPIVQKAPFRCGPPGDQLFGPVHSNDRIQIYNAANGAVFHGAVTTARTVVNAHRASFRRLSS